MYFDTILLSILLSVSLFQSAVIAVEPVVESKHFLATANTDLVRSFATHPRPEIHNIKKRPDILVRAYKNVPGDIVLQNQKVEYSTGKLGDSSKNNKNKETADIKIVNGVAVPVHPETSVPVKIYKNLGKFVDRNKRPEVGNEYYIVERYLTESNGNINYNSMKRIYFSDEALTKRVEGKIPFWADLQQVEHHGFFDKLGAPSETTKTSKNVVNQAPLPHAANQATSNAKAPLTNAANQATSNPLAKEPADPLPHATASQAAVRPIQISTNPTTPVLQQRSEADKNKGTETLPKPPVPPARKAVSNVPRESDAIRIGKIKPMKMFNHQDRKDQTDENVQSNPDIIAQLISQGAVNVMGHVTHAPAAVNARPPISRVIPVEGEEIPPSSQKEPEPLSAPNVVSASKETTLTKHSKSSFFDKQVVNGLLGGSLSGALAGAIAGGISGSISKDTKQDQ